MSLRVSLAGQVGVEVDGRRVDAAGLGRLGRLAFAYLVVERHRPVARDELAEALWGEDLPTTWDTSLRGVIAKVRTWLERAGLDRSDAVTSSYGTYQVHLPAGATVDVEAAADDLAAARAALSADEVQDALARVRAAITVAANAFLPGATGGWVERRQAELHELLLASLETLADAATAAGDAATALAAADEATAAEPLRESAHLRVMRAHAAAGNRGEALRAYEALRRLLAEELGVSPSATTDAAYLALLADEPVTAVAAEEPGPTETQPPGALVASGRGRLPASLSSFVGRAGELAEVTDLLASARLVTLVGAGGMGKTRLAVEAARAVETATTNDRRVVLVALGEVTGGENSGDSVVRAAMSALGVVEVPDQPPIETLADTVAGSRLLLVLDNCEHVAEAAAALAGTLLAASPELTLLATSREPLHVPGEQVWRVPPLAAADAARLFVERAREVDPEFAVAPTDETAVAALVHQLDGLPLAIELAAARADVLTVAEILERLDDRFRLLTAGARTAPARQQTLRGAVDWTYDRLTDQERSLLQAVSVFAGSFSLADAVAVSGRPEADVLDALARLVGRSLVLASTSGRARRYRMLQTIRAYAAERLRSSDRATDVDARLVAWAADLAERAEAHLDGPDQAAWLARLEADLPNVRAAVAATATLAAASAGARLDGEAALDWLRLVTAIARFMELRGRLSEGREWLRTALASPATDEAPALLLARAHNAAALLAQRQGDYAAARSRLEESLAIRRRAGDRLGVAVALHGLGNVAALQHDHAAARMLYDESLAIGRELDDLSLVAAALANLGWVEHATANFEMARGYYEEALGVRREIGDQLGIGLLLGHLGDLAFQQGDYAAARAFHTDSLRMRTALGDRAGRADSLATLGHLALHDGDLATARDLLDENLAVRRDLGDRAGLPAALMSVADAAVVAGDLDAARAHLDEAVASASENRDGATRAHALVHRARVERLGDDPARALERSVEARQAVDTLGADVVTAEWLEGVGAALAASGAADRGARLLGAADALRRMIGAAVPRHEMAAHDRDVVAVRGALGSERFAQEWEAGAAFSVDRAVEEAISAIG